MGYAYLFIVSYSTRMNRKGKFGKNRYENKVVLWWPAVKLWRDLQLFGQIQRSANDDACISVIITV